MATKETKLIDKKSIKELVDILDEMELTSLSYKKGDISISVTKGMISTTVNTNNIQKSQYLSLKQKLIIETIPEF